ncbi:GumC domain-containing protein [Amycolatopsis thermophila]|uniref:Capsular polysaccharide biosynthesis protein n=1 Tax=Amycolatopsis thermophila TaxID=206084 RepID=A0ABU0EQT9_9PSEU|nr:exopolysaccharide biosynthesis protein [Amycolatopsis thermophila]MDQ0377642.1 capsular polysaccharide biosynthesis protein [Amycolatopsis thermophila]
MIGRILRRRWRVLAALAVLGALVGAGASLLFSPGYQTTSNVLLQGSPDSSELMTEARVATSSVVLDRTAQALAWGVSGPDLLKSVSAGAADGNIVVITAEADTPEKAQQLADQVAKEYVNYSAQLLGSAADAASQIRQEQADALRRQVQETNDTITDLSRRVQGVTVESVEVRTQLETLRTSLTEAMAKLDQLGGNGRQAQTVVMGSAERPSAPAAPTMTHFVGGGAIVFFLLGVLGHLIGSRVDRRLRDESEIAAAVGGPLLGSVDVPATAEHAPPAAGGHWWSKLLKTDEPWNLPELNASADPASREIRYRRVLSRLGDSSGVFPRVLVLVTEDDPVARSAVSQLVAAGRGERPELRVAVVDPERPTVPDDNDSAGVLVVVTSGSRTGWELVGLTEAAADAGQRVLGAVVVQRTAAVPEPKGDQPAGDEALAGSA